MAVVTNVGELAGALQSGATSIEVRGELRGMPMVTLGPGVRLRGGTLVFGAKGVCLTSDNELDGVTIRCPEHEVAILNDTRVSSLGTLALRDVKTTGQVLILARDAVKAGQVRVAGLQVLADVRGRVDRPRGFGVEAMQGAFTLWNLQPDPKVVIEDAWTSPPGRQNSPCAGVVSSSAGTGTRTARRMGVSFG